MNKYFASTKLIQHCKKIVKDPDVIMDVYDQSFAWASDKVTKILGFSHEDLTNTRVMNLRVKDKSDEEDLMEHTAKKDYIDNFPMRTKNGNMIIVNARVVYIEFEKNPYQIVKVINVTTKK